MKQIPSRLGFLLLLISTLTAFSPAAYYPQGDPRSGGMSSQVLIYALDGTYYGRSRMPWISEDENTLFLAVGGGGEEEIWYSTKSSGKWLGARRVSGLNMTGYSSQVPSLDSSMNRIYFTSSRPVGSPYNLSGGIWRIFTATRNPDGTWNTPYLVNNDAAPGVTVTTLTDGEDFAVFLSRDGNTLYFNSSRSGGSGGYDIWYSTKDNQGKWTTPINIGAPINSSNDEKYSGSVSKDNLKLYFGSNRTDIRTKGTDSWNIFCAVRASTTQSWASASIYQIEGLSPALGSLTTSSGIGWPCITANDSTLYYSDKGPFMWYGDSAEIFTSLYLGGYFQAGRNPGRAINNIKWYLINDFLPFISYTNATTGLPQDWLFDSMLFMALSGSSTGARYDGATYKDDWTGYLESIFYPDRELSKLNEAVYQAKTTLNDPSYKLKMAVMIPYPSTAVTNFGDVDGDSITENLSNSSNRLKVVNWYLNDFLSRWSTANFQNIDLKAMYWMVEGIGSDGTFIRQVATEVHNRGLKFEWIPSYAGYVSNWTTYGFDLIQYQPNYAWMSPYSNTSRITTAALRARTSGMGIELELDYRPYYGDGLNYRTYLDYGLPNKENYMTNCFLGCYQDVYAIKAMANSSLASAPYARDGYDSLYQFLKKRYPYPVSVGKSYSYNTPPTSPYTDTSFKKLNDYFYMPDTTTTGRIVGFYSSNPTITFDLVSSCWVEKVYLHAISYSPMTVAYPASMQIELSNDNSQWISAGITSLHRADSSTLTPGDMLVKFTPQSARYVRITLTRSSSWIWMDELQIYGNYLPPTGITDWERFSSE